MRIHAPLFDRLVAWARTPAPRNPPAVFLYGGPGIGKTTLAHTALAAAGLRVVEWNASQHRHRAAVEDTLLPLLHSRNVSDFFRPEGPRSLGLVLDEVDGMSVGDKGGLSELVRLLREYRGDNAIICISNEWAEKRYAPFLRHCMALEVPAPTDGDVAQLAEAALGGEASLPGSEVAEVASALRRLHGGDLRKVAQTLREAAGDLRSGALTAAGLLRTASLSLPDPRALASNRVRHSETLRTAVGNLLRGQLDILSDVPLNNNDLNLAGLHLHESLPLWLRRHVGGGAAGLRLYADLFDSVVASDRLDYYTFFYQHWSLFPVSYQAKLQAVNVRLFASADAPTEAPKWEDADLAYTSVLSRQSFLYNQFRYLQEMRALSRSDAGLDGAWWTAALALLHTAACVAQPPIPTAVVVVEPAVGRKRAAGTKASAAPRSAASAASAAALHQATTIMARLQCRGDPPRFLRCLKALTVPLVPPVPLLPAHVRT